MKKHYKSSDCILTPSCLIICGENGSQLLLSKSDARVPRELREQYQECITNKQVSLAKVFHDKNSLEKKCHSTDDVRILNIVKITELDKIREHIKLQLERDEVFFPKLLGSGQFGVVVEICAKPALEQVIVVKIAINNASLRGEYLAQVKFAQVGLAPIPFAPRSMFLPYFLMGKIDGTVGDLLVHELLESELDGILTKCLQLIFRMCDHHMTHGDLHFKNIGYVKDPTTKQRLYLCLDFAGVLPGCFPEIDMLQLIRDTYNTAYHTFNRHYLRQKLHTIYEANYKPLHLNFAQISNYRMQLLKDYQRFLSNPNLQTRPPALKFTDTLDIDTDTDSETDEHYENEGDDEGDLDEEQEEEDFEDLGF